jgi:flagellar protein FlaG
MGIPSVSQFGSAAAALTSKATSGNGASPVVDLVAQAQPQQAQDSKAAANAANLDKALQEIESAVQAKTNNLQFSVDDSTGKTVVKVIDSSTGDTIRQFPSEEVLSIARNIERMKGFLLKDSA